MPSESAGLTTFHVPAVRGAGNRRRAFLGIIVLAVALALVVGAGRALWDVASQTDFAARNLAPGPAHEVLHHELGHRRPADVAVADEEDAADGPGAIHDQLSPNEAKYDALSNGAPRP